MDFEHRFAFPLGAKTLSVCFQAVEGAYRRASLRIEGERELPIVLSHCPSTEALMYLGKSARHGALRRLMQDRGMAWGALESFVVPGAFVLGPERTALVAKGVATCVRSPEWESLLNENEAAEIVAFPVLREGMKYGLTEALLASGGRFCEEVVVDAHHVADASVPLLGRRMELDAFKDSDLTPAQRERVKVAVIGDSIASGTVVIGLVDAIMERFPCLQRVELIAPLAAIYGLARIAAFASRKVDIRIHTFEALLNALPPDFYFSPHFAEPQMHMVPEAEARYREWWGRDAEGNCLSDTCCVGYGWSEAFFNPSRQLRLIEAQLKERHGMSLSELFQRKRYSV